MITKTTYKKAGRSILLICKALKIDYSALSKEVKIALENVYMLGRVDCRKELIASIKEDLKSDRIII
jgi:hypothetical protein